MIFLGLMAIIFIAFPAFFVRLFIDDPIVIRSGVMCLRIIAYGYVFYALGMVMVQAFNGAGDTVTPLWINLFCFWALEIPLAYTLAHGAGLGPNGVFWAIACSESTMAVLAILLFRRGTWKLREV